MRPIPPALKEKIAADPYMKKCARRDGKCDGRITWEHCWIYGGKQINEPWAIIPLCVYHHLGPGLDKHENQRISLRRATREDLAKYPKKNWDYEARYLNI